MESKPIVNFGIVGLTEESKSILLNMHDLGYVGCIYDFNYDKVKFFLENEAKETKILGAETIEIMTNTLTEPRCIMILVEDSMIQDFIGIGLTIDDFIDLELLPHMSYQDYILDVSSSGRADTKERTKDLMEKGIRYVGIKGGPSVGLIQGICISLENERIWTTSDIQISTSNLSRHPAKRLFDNYELDDEKKFCCYWGKPGNKQLYIEFAIDEISQQNNNLLTEARNILKHVAMLKEDQSRQVFRECCKGDLNSQDCKKAGSKVDEGELTDASEVSVLTEDQQTFVNHLEKAMLACQIINYARGLASIREVDQIHQWDINYTKLKPVRPQNYPYKSALYRKIKSAFTQNPQLQNILLDENFAKIVNENLQSVEYVISKNNAEMERVRGKWNDQMFPFTEGFQEALEYYQNFTANKLLCAKLFDIKSESNVPTEEFDLSPLYKYQYQMKAEQLIFEKIETTVEKFHEVDKWTNAYIYNEKADILKDKIKNLLTKPKVVYEAYMKHMKKDEQVTAMHLNILSTRITDTKRIADMYLYNTREPMKPEDNFHVQFAMHLKELVSRPFI